MTAYNLQLWKRQFQQQQAKELMQQGVHLIDPNRFDLRGNCEMWSEMYKLMLMSLLAR